MRIIAGEFRGRPIEAPDGRDTRPTASRVREALFNMLMADIPGARVLDLFAGSGALALESLSRGAAYALVCDTDAMAIKAVERNAQTFGVRERMGIIRGDALSVAQGLAKQGEQFDIIFLDPPYRKGMLAQAIAASQNLLLPGGRIIAESLAAETPQSVPGICLKNTRKYGDSRITIFEKLQEEERP